MPFGGDNKSNPTRRAVGAMMTAPLQAVAQIAGHGGDEAVAILESKGIRAKNKEQTIAEIARANRTHPMRVLDVIF
jgi:hypothetical protein